MNGVVNIYKEKGYTSHDVTAIVRGIMRADKIGHTGTLDPDATGVLPVCLGKATKAAELIMGCDKEYIAEFAFGAETDTQDASGTVTARTDYVFDEEAARAAILSFQGGYDQLPPMYSAVKMGGVKLYELAREGIEVERKSRFAAIPEIEILALSPEGGRIRVACAKGTYIRTLCEDIGRRTGYLAHMTALERTASGPYRKDTALTLDELRAKVAAGDYSFFVSLDSLFAYAPRKIVPPEDDIYLKNGNPLTYPDETLPRETGARVRLYLSDGTFAGLYKVTELLPEATDEEGKPLPAAVRMKAEKMFV